MTNLLHETHPGIIKMKLLARSYVWWPGIYRQRSRKLQQGVSSLSATSKCGTENLLEFPKRPWQRLHVDFACPLGHMWLITDDAYSKWPEMIPIKVTTTTRTIEELCTILHGLPVQIVGDNKRKVAAFYCDTERHHIQLPMKLLLNEGNT